MAASELLMKMVFILGSLYPDYLEYYGSDHCLTKYTQIQYPNPFGPILSTSVSNLKYSQL